MKIKNKIKIKLEHVRKVYPNAIPLSDINAEIQDGDVISVIGPSGTGKSTMLRCINLLEKPDSGKIFLDDDEITSRKCNIPRIRQKMGMVFQSFNLFGHLTVIENIMLAPVKLKGKTRQEAYETGVKLLNQVGLTDKAMNYPDELSGGQKQRIAIARALAMDPDVILFDEPTSALDPTMVGEVQTVIRELTGTGKTMIIVTHEMNFARSICNRVFYLDEGKIYEEGTPEEIFLNPKLEKTRRFIRNLKVLELTIKKRDFDFPGAVSSIESYCQKNFISRQLCNRVNLIFEEIIMQILIPSLEKTDIKFSAEYSEQNREINVTVSYKGRSLSLYELKSKSKSGNDANLNEISWDLLKGISLDMKFYENLPDEYKNKVTFRII